MNKKDRLMELLAELKELFPDLYNVATDSLEDPKFLLMANDDNFSAVAAVMKASDSYLETSIEEEQLMADMLEEDELMKLIGFEDDEDDPTYH